MQRLLTKYGLILHTAFVVLFPLLFIAQSRAFDFTPLLWLSLVAVEMMFLLPSVRRGETLTDARQRVVRALSWDPFLYVGLAIVAVVVVQWLNSGRELVYLSDADVWQFSPPAVTWLPFCVETQSAFAAVSVFVACVVVGLILRVAVSKGAKRLLLQGLAGVSGVVAVYAVWQACRGGEPYATRALAQGGGSMGSFFGFWLLMGMGVFADALARYQRGTILLFLLGVVGNLMGMLFFASVFALSAYVVLAILLAVYWIVYLGPHVSKQIQLKLFLISLFTAASVTLLLLYAFPGNPVTAKLKAALPVTAYWDTLADIRGVRTTAALNLWQEHPWVGIGQDGFRQFSGLAVADKSWGLLKTDPSNVYNDSLQFLCEFGVLGVGLLLAAVITLLVPVCRRARIAWKSGTHDKNNGRLFLLRISPVVLTGVLATLLCFVESWIASPFRAQGLLMSWICVLAVMPAFLPERAHTAEPQF